MVYDCLISGYGVAVTRHPSKLKSPVRTRLPALGSRYADSIERRQRKLSQRIKTSRQCPRNWCKSSNFAYSPIAQRQSRELLTLRFLVRIEVGELKGLETFGSFIRVGIIISDSSREIGAAVAQLLYTQTVIGSNPIFPTCINTFKKKYNGETV